MTILHAPGNSLMRDASTQEKRIIFPKMLLILSQILISLNANTLEVIVMEEQSIAQLVTSPLKDAPSLDAILSFEQELLLSKVTENVLKKIISTLPVHLMIGLELLIATILQNVPITTSNDANSSKIPQRTSMHTHVSSFLLKSVSIPIFISMRDQLELGTLVL